MNGFSIESYERIYNKTDNICMRLLHFVMRLSQQKIRGYYYLFFWAGKCLRLSQKRLLLNLFDFKIRHILKDSMCFHKSNFLYMCMYTYMF